MNLPRSIIAAFVGAMLFGELGQTSVNAEDRSDDHLRAARASWTPTRSKRTDSKPHASASRAEATAAVQPKSRRSSQLKRPVPLQDPQSKPTQRSRTSRSNQAVKQAAYQHTSVPTPPPMEGEVYYEPTIVDAGCDAMPSCGCEGQGCDAIGCDAMGSCGPNCGCSLCGELPSGRAWRPALTVSLPQDGWISFEGLTMWSDGMDLPALITQSPSGTAQADAGVLTRSTTTTIFGGPGNDLFEDSRGGWRLRFGFWLDRCHTLGIGAEYLDLDRDTTSFSATSTGDPVLARPFFNTLTGSADSELVAFNDGANIQLTGTAAASAYTELVGGSVYLRWLRCCDEGCREWLFCGCNGHYCTRSEFRIGYRFMELNEGVMITEDLQNNGTTNVGQFDIMDRFDTENQFNGLDLAWNHRLTRGYWTLESLVRIAVGNNRQTVRVAGQTTIVDQNDPNNVTTDTFDAGLLALASNSGEFQQDEFAVLPELNLILGYQLTDHFKATLGYTGIYLSNVVRPGQHIPTGINPDFLPPAITSTGDARPLFAFDTTDYWVHGLTYGLEYRW